MEPLPGAAGGVMPFSTLKVRLTRYCTVMPFSIMAAAVSYAMPSGSFTSRSAGLSRTSE
jgi:hypothetical protein